MTLSVVTLTLLGSIMPDAPVAVSFLDALRALEAQRQSAVVANAPMPFVVIKIRSSGGLISMAADMARLMYKLQPVCYVAEAQSAALQVVLPACARIIIAKDSLLGFHSGAGCYPTNLYDGQDALLMLRESLGASLYMARIMQAGLGAANEQSCVPLRRVWPEIAQAPCSVLHMFAETVMPAAQFKALFPDKQKIVVIDKQASMKVAPYPKTQGEGESLCQ